MTKEEARRLVLDSFEPDWGCFSQVIPFRYTNFTDTMAWLGVLLGASLKVEDFEVAEKCERTLGNLLLISKHARNYAPVQVTPSWKRSSLSHQLWYKKKRQYIAGPTALNFAIQNGSNLENPYLLTFFAAWSFVILSHIFGRMLKWPLIGKYLRQHVNSVFFAHLMLGKRPPQCMEFLAEDNPFYSYLYGKKMNVEYPPDRRYTNGVTVERKEIVPMSKRKPSSWIWKDWPFNEYMVRDLEKPEYVDYSYTPVAYLAAVYLQETLN